MEMLALAATRGDFLVEAEQLFSTLWLQSEVIYMKKFKHCMSQCVSISSKGNTLVLKS